MCGRTHKHIVPKRRGSRSVQENVRSLARCEKKALMKEPKIEAAHFFLPPLSASVFLSQDMTLPNITTPLPSMKATRDKPSQFLKVSQTSGCCGWKLHCAISLDFNECGSSIFLPPVSFPIFHFNLEIRQAERPHRTNPIGE